MNINFCGNFYFTFILNKNVQIVWGNDKHLRKWIENADSGREALCDPISDVQPPNDDEGRLLKCLESVDGT